MPRAIAKHTASSQLRSFSGALDPAPLQLYGNEHQAIMSYVFTGDKKEFSKLKFRTYDLPYDYLSVLHYASDAYAINETIPTVKPRIPVVSITTIGQRKGLSPTDVKRVKMPYMCGDRATDAATWNKYGLDRREFARSKTNQIL